MTQPSESHFRQSVLEAAERLQGKLIRYASRILTGDETAARDVVQHAFLQLCAVARDSRPNQIDAWLFRVCRNKAIDVQRRGDRLKTGQQQAVYEYLDEAPSTSQKLDQDELWQLIQERIEQLPEAQREAIELWSNGFRHSEVAKIMGRNETTVRVMVHRAITRLRSDARIRGWLGSELDSNEKEKQTSIC